MSFCVSRRRLLFSLVSPLRGSPRLLSPLDHLLLRNRAFARTLPRARVGPGALSAHRQPAAMAHAAEAPDFHQPLDVHRDFLAQVAFDAALLLDDPADLAHVVFGQILDAYVGADPGVLQDPVRADAADAVDVGQTDLHALGAGQINSSDARHKSSLPLPPLVLLIRTNDPHDAAAPHDLAFVANPFHRRSNLHSFSTIRPFVTSFVISIRTRSPTSTRTKLRSIRSAMCAVTNPPSSSRTRYSALGSDSATMPVIAATLG